LREEHADIHCNTHKTRKDQKTTMKNKLFAIALAAGMLDLLPLGTSHTCAAGAGTVSYTQNIHDQTDVFSGANPCTGVPGTLTVTYNSVFHVTTQASGETWATFTQTGSISFVPDDSTQPSYSGHATFWGNFNLNQQSSNSTSKSSIRVVGTDGSVITQHDVAHFLVTPTGVTVSWDKPSLTRG
jgi:hypothetical protein